MELAAISRLQIPSLLSPFSQTRAITTSSHYLSFEIRSLSFPVIRNKSFAVKAKKKNSQPPQILDPSFVQEVSMADPDEDSLLLDDELDDDDLDLDEDFDYDFEEEFLEEEAETLAGDGSGGGGISLAGTEWDKEALAIAEQVCLSFDGDLGIYAFKTLSNFIVRIRIEKLSIKSGSPDMADIEAFAKAYKKRLDEAEATGSVPNVSLEVSSPGVERVVSVPQDLDRFKERPMFVKYISEAVESSEPNCEKDGIFRLVSYDIESRICVWGIADVRVNREKAGKGRPLNKKQRELRIETPFDSLRLVRLYSEI